jgi:hypothetical protein
METKQILEFQITQKLKNFNLQKLQQVFSFLQKVEKDNQKPNKLKSIKSLQGIMSECKASSVSFIENKQLEKLLER